MDEFGNCANRLKGYFDDLEEYRGKTLTDKKDFYAASMIAFSIINEAIRLAEFCMAKRALPAPNSYKEMIDTLSARGFISRGLAQRMKLVVAQRNLIAHEYGDIGRGDVERLIRQLGVVKDFAGELSRKAAK